MAKRGPKTEADLRAELEGGAATATEQPAGVVRPGDVVHLESGAVVSVIEMPSADQRTAEPATSPATTPATDLEDDVDSSTPAAHVVPPDDSYAIDTLNDLADDLVALAGTTNVLVESLTVNVRACVEADRPVLQQPLSAEATAAHLGAWAASPTEGEALAWRQQPVEARTRVYAAAEAIDKAVANLKAAADYAVRRRFELVQHRVLPLVRR